MTVRLKLIKNADAHAAPVLDQGLIRDCVAYAGAMGAYSSRFDADPDGNSANAGDAIGDRLRFFNEHQGFGFVAREDGGDDIFVHISNCAEGIKALAKGQRVRFDERIDKRNGKPEAFAVALI